MFKHHPFQKYFMISKFITPVCFNSMNASTASTTLKPSIRKWVRRGRSFSPASQALPLVKERGVAVWRSACANLTSTTGACPHSPVHPRCEFTACFYDCHLLFKFTQTLKLSFILAGLPHSQRNNPLCSLFWHPSQLRNLVNFLFSTLFFSLSKWLPFLCLFMISNQVFLPVALNSGEVSGCSNDFKGLMSMPTPGALNIKRHLGQVKSTGNLKG